MCRWGNRGKEPSRHLSWGRCQNWDWTPGYTGPNPSPGRVGQTDRWARCRGLLIAGFWGSLIEPQFPSSEMEASGPSAWAQWTPGQKQPPAAPRGHCTLSMDSAWPPSLPGPSGAHFILGGVLFHKFRNWEVKPWASEVSSSGGWDHICFFLFFQLI